MVQGEGDGDGERGREKEVLYKERCKKVKSKGGEELTAERGGRRKGGRRKGETW